MSAHEEHSSFIKTPHQLVVIVLLSFVVPVLAIVLLVQLVLGRPGADPSALAPAAVAERIQPVGRVEFGSADAAAAPGARGGEQIVTAVCAACHQTGAANAPKIGDAAAWAPRIKKGLDGLLQTSLKGVGAMPPKGGGADLSDDELARAIVFMANKSGANFQAPAAGAAPAAAAQPAPAAPAPAAAAAKPEPAAAAAPAPKPAPAAAAPAADGADGKKIYGTVCVACHAAGVANAPRLGDKAAWAPRIQAGIDAMVKTVVTGKGAMPPKGGNAALTDAEIRATVEYMVSQSK